MNTPRTDAETSFVKCYPNGGEGLEVIDADFARQLERELTAEQEKVKRLREALICFCDMDNADLGKASLNNVRDDFMYDCPEYVGYCVKARAILEATK